MRLTDCGRLRVGHGFDSHRIADGRPLILGGVAIPSPFGLLGHSDADVLAHALIDALLGAAAAGDIGRWFPDSDPALRGADSLGLLRTVLAHPAFARVAVVNADTILVAERPRLAPYADAIRSSLADALGCDISRVSVKGKTAEGMGFCGNGEGMAAFATVLVDMEGRAPSAL